MSRPVFMFVAILMAYSTLAAAPEITPFFEKSQLGVTIKNLSYPDTFSKDLVSGLTNKILIRVELTTRGREPSRKILEVAVKYELWDEKFKVTNSDGDSATSRMLPNLEAVLRELRSIRIPNFMKSDGITRDQELRFTYAALLNPIDREKMEKIKDWVVQNSTATPADPTGFGSSRNVVQARKNTLFNQIFEQFTSGDRVAAAWRETGESKPFRLSEVAP